MDSAANAPEQPTQHTGGRALAAGMVCGIIGVAAILSALVITIRKWKNKIAQTLQTILIGMRGLGAGLAQKCNNTALVVGHSGVDVFHRMRCGVVNGWHATMRTFSRRRRDRRKGGPSAAVHRLVNLKPTFYVCASQLLVFILMASISRASCFSEPRRPTHFPLGAISGRNLLLPP